MHDVRRFDAVQDHVHDRNHIGKRLLFFTVKGALLKRSKIVCCQALLAPKIVERFAEEARRAAGAVIDTFANLGLHHLHHRPNKGAWGVVLAAVSASVTHVFDFCFIQVREFVLLGL